MNQAAEGLEATKLQFGFGGAPVLQEVSLTVERGASAALLGENGAGKSTLLNLLCGLLRPQFGTVRFGGQEIAALPVRERARRIAVTPQALVAPPAFTVRETVSLGRTPHLHPWLGEREADRAAVEAALGATHLTALADRRVGELSGGERQRVALALALAQEPELLLLDEATANLDLRHQVGMLSLVQGLIADRGLTVLATLHDPNLAGRFFQQLFVLHGGRIVAAGSPGEILRPEVLEPVFQIPLVSLPHPESGAPLLFWRGEDASRPPDAGRAAAQG